MNAQEQARAYREALYDGQDRGSGSDADLLRAIATMLDKVDDVTDATLAARGSSHRVGREMQADLRRIAEAQA